MGNKKVSQYALKLRKYKCQNCGQADPSGLKIIPRRGYSTKDPNGYLILCGNCIIFKDSMNLKPISGKEYCAMMTMNILASELPQKLQDGPPVTIKHGYDTRKERETANLPKSHHTDARTISGNPLATPPEEIFRFRKVRRHNRSIQKINPKANGKRQASQGPYDVFGFHRYDTVSYDGQEYYIHSLRSSGFFDIRNLAGEKIRNGSVKYTELKRIHPNYGYISVKHTNTMEGKKDERK